MSEKSLKNSDFSIRTSVYCHLEIKSPVPAHGLTVHQVATQSDENCRSLPEINHI